MDGVLYAEAKLGFAAPGRYVCNTNMLHTMK